MTGYFDYITEILRPLGIYNLTRGTVVASENYAAGGELDGLASLIDSIFCNLTPAEASEEALRLWESLFPHTPPHGDTERRRALSALFSVGDRSFTLSELRRCLEVCGLTVGLTELDDEQVVIDFPDIGGIPHDFDRITDALELILPCHLGIVYIFHYITWGLFETLFGSWQALEDSRITWQEIELLWR